ncbi:heat shock protein 60 [Moniliophthora roreri]|nr:heat shock protein 60 [Moniliophthora roreri]
MIIEVMGAQVVEDRDAFVSLLIASSWWLCVPIIKTQQVNLRSPPNIFTRRKMISAPCDVLPVPKDAVLRRSPLFIIVENNRDPLRLAHSATTASASSLTGGTIFRDELKCTATFLDSLAASPSPRKASSNPNEISPEYTSAFGGPAEQSCSPLSLSSDHWELIKEFYNEAGQDMFVKNKTFSTVHASTIPP